MVDIGLYLVFIVTVVLICIVPGTDMVYIITHGVSMGVRAALVASLGMSVGMMVHTTAVVLGLGALVAASPTAYALLRYAGAAYLVYLGVRTLLDSRHRPETAEPDDSGSPVGRRLPMAAVFGRAVVTNVLNPKIVVFYLAFLPQFVRSDQGGSSGQLLVLGLTFVVIGLLIDAAVALASGRIGIWLRRDNRSVTWLNRLAGTVFLGLAASVSLT